MGHLHRCNQIQIPFALMVLTVGYFPAFSMRVFSLSSSPPSCNIIKPHIRFFSVSMHGCDAAIRTAVFCIELMGIYVVSAECSRYSELFLFSFFFFKLTWSSQICCCLLQQQIERQDEPSIPQSRHAYSPLSPPPAYCSDSSPPAMGQRRWGEIRL